LDLVLTQELIELSVNSLDREPHPSDTLALGLVTEAIGMGLPLVAAPALNSAQAAHPAFEHSVATLRAACVTVLYGPGIYEPGPPRTGGRPYEWGLVVRAVVAEDRAR
jgi:hypothetical protein